MITKKQRDDWFAEFCRTARRLPQGVYYVNVNGKHLRSTDTDDLYKQFEQAMIDKLEVTR